jgi:hypothetical protein
MRTPAQKQPQGGSQALKRSRAFFFGAASAALVTSAVFLAVPSLGGPGGSERERFAARHHTVVAASATAAGKNGPGLARIRDMEYKGVVQPGKEDGVQFKCPRKTPHAISGYFLPETPQQAGMVQLADTFPSGKGNRNWDIGVYNPSPAPQAYIIGAVCVK